MVRPALLEMQPAAQLCLRVGRLLKHRVDFAVNAMPRSLDQSVHAILEQQNLSDEPTFQQPVPPVTPVHHRSRSFAPALPTISLTYMHVSAYYQIMRRKPGELIPIERSILAAAVRLSSQAVEEFHGFRLAKEIRDREGARRLVAQGTLYRALARLEQQGILQSTWEDPVVAAEEHRPRRRLYSLTGAHVVELTETSVPRQGTSQLSWAATP